MPDKEDRAFSARPKPEEACSESSDRLKIVRRDLIKILQKGKRFRRVGWDVGFPSDWRPFSCEDPRTNAVFTEASAWGFIEELLSNDHPLEEITLRKPPGRRAYVMHPEANGVRLYVKIQLGAGVVIGRSFHESDPE